MNDKVVQLFPKKQESEEQKYLQGRACCTMCGESWAATAPVGTTWLQCPHCTFMRGRFLEVVDPGDETERWSCNCGNQLFLINKEGCFCINCGIWQNFGRT